jgi:transcriptional regulator with XRE-family HTH domain
MTRDYQQLLGDRLRSIRSQQGLTLQDVEERSDGEWKAVVIGSYERGDRAVSVAKLARLAQFYGVPMRDLLPVTEPTADRAGNDDAPRVILDLSRVPEIAAGDDAIAALSRYARRIQLQRGDYNGRVLSLRADDIRALATAFGRDPEDLVETLAAQDAILRSG